VATNGHSRPSQDGNGTEGESSRLWLILGGLALAVLAVTLFFRGRRKARG